MRPGRLLTVLWGPMDKTAVGKPNGPRTQCCGSFDRLEQGDGLSLVAYPSQVARGISLLGGRHCFLASPSPNSTWRGSRVSLLGMLKNKLQKHSFIFFWRVALNEPDNLAFAQFEHCAEGDFGSIQKSQSVLRIGLVPVNPGHQVGRDNHA